MTTPDELIAILNRLLDGSREEKDIEQFRNWSKTSEAQSVIQLVIQLGKYNTNIAEGQGIDIGDRIDTELLIEIRDLLRSQQASQSLPKSYLVPYPNYYHQFASASYKNSTELPGRADK